MGFIATGLPFLLSFLLSFTVYAGNADCQAHQCIAVVDAGSTGSRLHIYAYDLDETKTPVNVYELEAKKVKPGFASLETEQAAVDAYLNGLFKDSSTNKLPVYFYATAGMRLLPQSKQAKLYGLLKNWFANQPQWQLRSAKTISGNEEGVLGWLAVNYHLGSLSSKDKPAVGVMDMGGASVQITFAVANTEGIAKEDIRELELYGRPLKLFVHSFLGLGLTEVSHQFLNVASCFAQNYELPTQLLAQGDAYSCKAEVSPLINAIHHVNGLVQPALYANSTENWFVLGGMAELAQSQPFQFNNNQFTNQNLLEQTNNLVCQQQWSYLSSQYPGNDYLYSYCLLPAYYYALMVDGYGLQPQTAINYMASNQASDWTLGVVFRQ